MADSIPEQITDDIVSALEAISNPDYGFTPGAVEQERSHLIVNGRYPFIEVAGSSATVEAGTYTQGDDHGIEYVITYLDILNDTDIDNDDPLPKQVASVVRDLHKALMVDHTRGGLAIMIRLREYGYTNYTADGGEHFEVYMIIEVQTIIDTFDMNNLA
jgi:hypothetical protein